MTSFFQRLRDALWTAPAGARPRREIFLEDEFSETEVVPASTADWCRSQIAAITAFSARHELRGGGWSDVYVRPPAPRQMSDLRIPLGGAIAAIESLLPRFDAVLAGSTSRPVPARGAVAFGPSLLSAIVLTAADGSPNVDMLEIVSRGGATDMRAILGALPAVPSPEPLLVVDWAWREIVRPDSAEDVERYLRRYGR